MSKTWVVAGSRTNLTVDVLPNMPGVRIDRGGERFDKTFIWLRSDRQDQKQDLYMPVWKATGESANPFVITFKEPIHGMDLKCTFPKGKPGIVRSLTYLDTDTYPLQASLPDSTKQLVEAPDFDLKAAMHSPTDRAQIVKVVIFRADPDNPTNDVPMVPNDVIFGTTGWMAENLQV